MSTEIAQHVFDLYSARRSRYSRRDATGQRIRDILSNDTARHFSGIIREGEPVAPNIISSGARTLTQRIGRMPRIDCQSAPLLNRDRRTSDTAKVAVERHERTLMTYLRQMHFPSTLLQAAHWLIVHDAAPFIVRPEPRLGIPVIEVKDPLGAYPGTVWPNRPELYDCLFAQRVPIAEAKHMYPAIPTTTTSRRTSQFWMGSFSGSTTTQEITEVVIAEYHDRSGCHVVCVEPSAVYLDFYPSVAPGKSSVFLARGFSPDLDFHGQFDAMVPIFIAQAKLNALEMSYTEQMVFAETVVVGDVISNGGKWAAGPGAVNQIAPTPGASASKLTNNMSAQVFGLNDRLERAGRVSGQQPAQLSGEPNVSVATGKGIDQLTVAVDDNVNYYQQVLSEALTRVLVRVAEVAQMMDAPGSQHLQPDVIPYVRFLASADPAETVRMLQLQGAGDLSKLTIMDRLYEVDDPEQELARIDAEHLRDVLFQSLAQQAQTGAIDPTVVSKLITDRMKGRPLEDLVAEMAQQAQQQPPPMGPPGAPPGGQAPPLVDLLRLNPAGAPTGGTQMKQAI